jgi:hypothetical protein
MADIILTEKDIERFWSKTKTNPVTGCLEWTGTHNSRGYGTMQLRDKSRLAHRVAWVIATGVDPGEACVLHHCDNPPCVTVGAGHLFLGDRAANNRDAASKGRASGQSRTNCPAGHPYMGENLILYRGRRICRACRDAHSASWKKKYPDKQARASAQYWARNPDKLKAKRRRGYLSRKARGCSQRRSRAPR